MAIKRNIYNLSLLTALIVILISSCDKFEGSQTIPAYIQIDTFKLVRNPQIEIEVEGKLTHNITDVWVYINDQSIGAYELPAIIPVLAEGKNKIALHPGIMKNGISNTRYQYSFFKPDVDTVFDFTIDSIRKIIPKTSYYTETFFAWTENFEDGVSDLKPTNLSDTSLQIIYRDTDHPDLGHFTAKGYLTDEHTVLECATLQIEPEDVGNFEFPKGGVPVFLEMDYNINNILVVGLNVHDYGSQIIKHPVVIMNPTNGKWKKVYVNFTPTVSQFPNARFFNVFIRVDKQTTVESPVIKLDNFKLIHKEGY